MRDFIVFTGVTECGYRGIESEYLAISLKNGKSCHNSAIRVSRNYKE